jgi:hypothetical protein
MSTTRTPGEESAAPTGSVDELEELLLLLPQAVNPIARAARPLATIIARGTPLLSPVIVAFPPSGRQGRPVARELPTPISVDETAARSEGTAKRVRAGRDLGADPAHPGFRNPERSIPLGNLLWRMRAG